MDVRQYFDPVNFSRFSETEDHGWKYSLGQRIEKSTLKLTTSKIQKLEIAIVGVPFVNGSCTTSAVNSANKIRKELYNLAAFDCKTNIVDFGNLKEAQSTKGTYLALRDITEYFTELGIVTVIIGGSQDLSLGVCEAYKNKEFFTFSAVDAVLDLKKGRETFNSTNYLTKVFTELPQLFQFSLIAYQRHLVSPAMFSKTKGVDVHLPLGLLKENLLEAEPILRNTDFLSFDFGAIKTSEAKGNKQINPNGLFGEEACQLAKYAGFSQKVKTFGLFEADVELDNSGLTEKLAAQIIWYFIEGYINRIDDVLKLEDSKINYKVEVNGVEKPIVFYNCDKTDRWWFEIETIEKKRVYIACSKKEYERASLNEIPELWLKYIQKTDEISK